MTFIEVYWLNQVLKYGQELDPGLGVVESILSKGNSRQKSGEDANDTERSLFTRGQLGRNVELRLEQGPDFKGTKLKQFSSTSHENIRKGSTNACTQ